MKPGMVQYRYFETPALELAAELDESPFLSPPVSRVGLV